MSMTLESLVSPRKAAKNINVMLFIGFLYATVALFLSTWIFKSQASLIMVFLTVIATIPFMYRTMRMEEEYDVKLRTEWSMLKEHALVLKGLMALFSGFVLAYSLWFVRMGITFTCTGESQRGKLPAVCSIKIDKNLSIEPMIAA